ncbi:MAG: LytTR family transcriptional regulator DNA-binding domain-containing protein [Saprospirales bacterium]|nr:LytTR family transcriptional regulator DNA-binding domain-containing protein [Saprospirales bacterium]
MPHEDAVEVADLRQALGVVQFQQQGDGIHAVNCVQTEPVGQAPPDLAGFTGVKGLGPLLPALEIVDQVAGVAPGFDLNASDYLLKPISFERFCQSINKLQLQPSLPPATEHLFVKTDGKNKYVKVLVSDIQYIEGLSNYVILHCTQQKVTTYSTLKNLEESLSSGHFIRVHKAIEGRGI